MALSTICIVAGCIGIGGIGGWTLVGTREMTMVHQIGDPELTADAKRFEGKSYNVGPEYYAAQCVQEYIQARYGEQPGAQNLTGMPLVTYANCAALCKSASVELRSEYSDIAAKYRLRCERGLASADTRLTIDALAQAVQRFEAAKAPLELFLAERGCQQLIAQSTSGHMQDDRLAKLTADAQRLSDQHAAAIRQARAFYEGAESQANMQQREAINAERQAIRQDMSQISQRQRELDRNGSLDAYMHKRELDDQLRTKQHLLDAKDRELARLEQEYVRLASQRGVL